MLLLINPRRDHSRVKRSFARRNRSAFINEGTDQEITGALKRCVGYNRKRPSRFDVQNEMLNSAPFMKLKISLLALACLGGGLRPSAAAPNIARTWNEEILAAIRIDLPHPPVHARNLFHFSAAMYDAWAAYDSNAVGYIYHAKHSATDLAAARHEAISYAAYRILGERYALSRNSTNTLLALAARMNALGYDTNNVSQDPSTPAGVGNRVAAAISSYFINDGARQLFRYADLAFTNGGYAPTNLPMITGDRGTLAVDVNRWQPLAITNAVTQNDLPAEIVQPFLGAQWLGVRPFSLTRTHPAAPWIDPGPQPMLNGTNHAQFVDEVVEILRKASELTPDDGVEIDISPGAFGNNSVGRNDGTGHPVNPATGQPYASNVVRRGDFARVLAEFWADGPQSETPPGHWNTIANQVGDHPAFAKRLGGTGPVVDDLEWDVKLYFALNGALHDAACAAWGIKRYYDGGRPISFIRFMGQRGQSTDPSAPNYHTNGLPLVPGLIEQVTPVTAQFGQRHFGFPIGAVVVLTWPGQPADPTNQYSGVKWMRPDEWITYQKKTFITPAFPGYISGHSTFSRAAAEVMAAITGSPYFPGGIGTFTAESNTFLTFERGPSRAVELQWGTYFDAADQAGLSRLWGGIHVSADDLNGRRVGQACGQSAWMLARSYFDGSITNEPIQLAMQPQPNGAFHLRFSAVRGFAYQLESDTDVAGSYSGSILPLERATENSMTVTNMAPTGPQRFFRIKTAPE
jgi:hypothetical protein